MGGKSWEENEIPRGEGGRAAILAGAKVENLKNEKKDREKEKESSRIKDQGRD